jgi:hypothetical protein
MIIKTAGKKTRLVRPGPKQKIMTGSELAKAIGAEPFVPRYPKGNA